MKTVLNNKSIVYVSGHSPELDPGVDQKVHGLVDTAQKMGLHGIVLNKYLRTVRSRIRLFKQVFDTDARYIFIRSFGWINLAIIPYVIKARWQGRKVICDQPNSLSCNIKQIKSYQRSSFKRFMSIALTYIHGPFGYMQFNRIIQYDNESPFFSLGVRHKMILMGNGIDADKIMLRKKDYTGNSTLKIVGVATLKNYHGYDRLIRAIAFYNQRNNKKATFYIVGGLESNPVLIDLKQLTVQLGIEDSVIFYGPRDTDFINELYGMCDVAVDSLCWARFRISTCSTLKVREYALAGIPFISASNDPDFVHDEPFRITVPNDESIEPLVEALEDFPNRRKLFTDEQIRQFALDNLTYESKLKTMINGLL